MANVDLARALAICAEAEEAAIGMFDPASVPMPEDWRPWLRKIAPRTFTGSFATFHEEFWDWYWEITRKRRLGLSLTDNETVFLAIWCRGGGKSSNVEMAAIAEGALIGKGYVLYISSTQDLAEGHVNSIRDRLESPEIAESYPHLANPSVGKFGNRHGWRQNFLSTEGGWAIRPLGLDVNVRGGKVGDLRPTLIILDDVDEHDDSPAVVEKKLQRISKSIVPAGTKHTIILGAQNLIHRNSVFNQILTRKSDVLSRRIISGPFPAFEDLEIEPQSTEDGIRNVIVGGSPTWPDIDMAAAQKFLDDSGRADFMTEYQHDLTAAYTGAVFPEWDELYHVITWSEFVRFFGAIACGCTEKHNLDRRCPNPHIPLTWNLGRGLDWGTTPGHPCVNVWTARPAERDALNDSVFVYRELCRPKFPPKAQAEQDLVNPRRIAEAILAEERRWAETERITMSILSHEASATQNTFLDPDEPEFNRLRFIKHQAKTRLAGIPQIQNALQIDQSKPHPFRRHPVTSEALMGCPKLFVVVADGQGEVVERQGKWMVRPALDEKGFSRLRYEMPLYHYPQTAEGNEKHQPLKRDDDAIDALKHVAKAFFPRRAPKPKAERTEEQLPPQYRMDYLNQASPPEWDANWPNRQAAIEAIEKQSRRPKGGRYTKDDLDNL